MRIQVKDQKIFPMAGLWTTFTKEDGTKLHTCTIITTEANDFMKDIHDRMPVILDEEERIRWLNTKTTNIYELSQLLKPYPSSKMKAYEVSSHVNNASHDEPDCITPIK
jgi:putative SOS response-associated peptidase YedK